MASKQSVRSHRVLDVPSIAPGSQPASDGPDDLGDATRRRRHANTRVILAVILGSLAFAGATFWAGTTVHGRVQTVPQRIVEPPPTAKVEHRVLVDGVSITGNIVAPSGFTIEPLTPEIAATQPLVTELPMRVGSRVEEGALAVEVAGAPIFVLQGSIPMYRPFRIGMTGKDVTQFQADLEHLGYAIYDSSGYYGSSTAAAAKAMFAARGYDLASANGESASGQAVAPEASQKSASKAARASKVKHRPADEVPVWSIVFVPHLPAYVTAVSTRVGQRLAGKLAVIASGRPVARASVEATQATSIRVGLTARVTWGGSQKAWAHVSHVFLPAEASPEGGSASSSGSSGKGQQPSVTLAFSGHAKIPPIGSQVAIDVRLASTHLPVWAVPFSAVQTKGDGSSYITIVSGRRQVDVPVEVGSSAQGYVAVKPLNATRLSVEDRVTVGA